MKTRDVNTRIVIVLGLVFCMALFQIAAAAEAVETTSEIFVPDGGVTIVLRAPTSGNPQIIKISKDRNGNYKQEVIQSLGVYLPKKTPVFFSVDQVNTALYDVNIIVEELKGENTEEQNVLLLPQFAEMLSFLEKTIGKLQSGTASISGSENNLLETPDSGLQAVKKKLQAVKKKLQAVKDLNSELDELLYMSEKPGFSGFKSIKSDAIDAVKELGLDNGTSEEFCAKAEEIIKEIHEVLDTVKASIKNSGNPDDKFAALLKDLGDPSKIKKEVVDVFAHTAKKLRRIETAKWRKDDKQERILREQIQYTCVITPAIALPEKYPTLQDMECVVTVKRTTELSDRKFTFGSFIARNVKANCQTEGGPLDNFSEDFAILTHIPLYSHNFTRFKWSSFRWAAAISGGLGLGNISNGDGKFNLLQRPTLLGVSCLFAPPKSESLLVLTVGGTVRPQEKDGKIIRPMSSLGFFAALTISYDIWGALKEAIGK